MSRPVQIVCDGCGKVKQDSNHWWIVGYPFRRMGHGVTLVVASTDDVDLWDDQFNLLDFCGQDCALKFISEQMSKGGC
jgi:hypothetical protein